MQTIKYGKARLARFAAERAYSFSWERVRLIRYGAPVRRAGITSLRRRP